jgi:hypothetical protein
MVVDDLHILGTRVGPAEADAVLVVDPDTVLSGAIAGQEFEAVPRGYAEVPEVLSLVELVELPSGDTPEFRRTSPGCSLGSRVIKDIAGALVMEGSNHAIL